MIKKLINEILFTGSAILVGGIIIILFEIWLNK